MLSIRLKGYPKEIVAKDGTPIVIRPLVKEDEQRLLEFFQSFPEEEVWFLRAEVQDPVVLHTWIEELDFERMTPLLAIKTDDGEVVAMLRLYRRPAGCMRHIGHIRILVHPAYRHQRIGSWMLLDIVKFAMDVGIEKLVAEFVAGIEEAAIIGAHRLDFFEQAVIKDYVRDPRGGYRDLVIMVKNIHREWSDF